jgi:hypothetical protein
MKGDFLMCAIGSDVRGFLHNKGVVVSEALVPFGQAKPFQGGCDRFGGQLTSFCSVRTWVERLPSGVFATRWK